MGQINRSCLIVTPRQPLIDWINHRPGNKLPLSISLDSAVEHHTFTFLVPEFTDPDELEDLLPELKERCFEEVLSFFESDDDLWPDTSDEILFDTFFKLSYSTYTTDLIAPQIILDYDDTEAFERVEKLFKSKKMRKFLETEMGHLLPTPPTQK